jgi:hypothetical protein
MNYDNYDMGFAPDQADFNKATESTDFELIPKGVYRAIVSKAEAKPTRDGMSQRLALELELQDAPYAGRRVWDGFIVATKKTDENSLKAVQIGRGHVTRLCMAVGLPNGFSSPSELCFKMFEVAVKIQPAREGYEASNRVSYFKLPEDAAVPGAAAPARAAKPAAKPAARPTPPQVSDEETPW